MFEKRKKVGGGGKYCGINKNQPQYVVVDAQKPQNDANEQSVKNTYKNQQDTHTRLNIASERKRIHNKKQCEESSMKNRINIEIKGNTYLKTSANGKAHIKIYPSAKYLLMWLFAFVVCLIGVSLIGTYQPNNNMRLDAVTTTVDDGTTADGFAGGSGTSADPYKISTPMQLRYLSKTSSLWSKSYKLTADIIITTSSWTPIGNSSTKFTGVFNGNGHRIAFDSGSKMSLLGGYAGLFGYASGATIENTGVNWASGLEGSLYIGGIVAAPTNTLISNCYNIGDVSSRALVYADVGISIVGGIVGCADSGTIISNCYNAGKVSAGAFSQNSYVHVYAGGILGSGLATIKNCYNLGKISASGRGETSDSFVVAGGISGNSSTIYNCFSVVGSGNAPSASIDLGSKYAGGIIGSFIDESGEESGSVKNCYYDYGGGSGTQVLTTADYTNNLSDFVKNATYFSSDDTTLSGSTGVKSWHENYPWDFKNTWTIEPALNNGYPILKNSIASYADYTINDATDLIALSNCRTSGSQNFSGAWGSDTSSPYIYVTNDITVTASSWAPIGTDSSTPFYGTFDGGGHLITFNSGSEMTFSEDYAGLFGYVSGATIKNVGVNWANGLSVSYAYQYAGGIVGCAKGNTTINGCYNLGNIKSSCGCAGGILGVGDGSVSNIIIDNCYNSGDIVSCNAGGIFGGIYGGATGLTLSLSNCYNTGAITGNLYTSASAGGITGYVNNSTYINNCYNTGKISAIVVAFEEASPDVCVGGISAGRGIIYNCFSATGEANAPIASATGGKTNNAYLGGICGKDATTVSGCYYDYVNTSGSNVTVNTTNVTAITSLATLMKVESNFTSGKIKVDDTTSYNWDTAAQYAWDFADTWEICLGANNNFPILKNSFMSFVDYTISSVEDLIALSKAKTTGSNVSGGQNFSNAWGDVSTHPYILVTNDITVTATSWSPIGNSTNKFYGTFDGGGHTITFESAVSLSVDCAGLFGYASRATIKNTGINWKEELSISRSGRSYVGGIAGYIYESTINACYNISKQITGKTTGYGAGPQVGGIVGYGDKCEISNCYNTGPIQASGSQVSFAGGIVGKIDGGTISNCYNIGAVYPQYVGGITAGGGEIYNCFSAVGSESAASAVGYFGISNSNAIYNSYYDYGSTADSTRDGKQVLSTANGGSYPNDLSYYVTKTSTYFSSTDKTLSGNNTDSWHANYPWNFDTVWAIDPEGIINNGYPYLQGFTYESVTSYSITYKLNDGSTADVVESCEEGATYTIKTPSELGYTAVGRAFLGWKDASGVTHKSGESIEELTGDIVLTAQWRIYTYTVVFYANAPSGTVASGSMANQSFTYGETKNLTTNAYKITNHKFLGWATTSTGSVAYTDGASVSNLSTTDGATVTLYAKWDKTTYTLSLTLNFNMASGNGIVIYLMNASTNEIQQYYVTSNTIINIELAKNTTTPYKYTLYVKMPYTWTMTKSGTLATTEVDGLYTFTADSDNKTLILSLTGGSAINHWVVV